MNAGAPTCATCGGVNTNPQSMQCRFCGQALTPQMPAAPQGYTGYGASPGGYGVPPGYGNAHAPGYPQPGYPQPGYPQPGHPQPGYPQQGYPVQGFNGFQGPGYVQRSGWSSGWSTFFWVRLAIAAVAIGISLVGACVSALAH